ncbi:putative drug resistance efflux protein [Gordonia araii NBRC 100433]|uniref:Putative drug resistance efflux protein n=1 Tax=Gordonia araii NBRC 100433 TaxID=1073574 RepID=G7H016_9ACTN|nr:putative drug resistance efflux protein [Gordonia araii NBRC 100433]
MGVLTLPVLLVSMDVSVLFLAMPQVSRDLGPSPAEALWILDSYSFVIAGLLITMGGLGDRVGRRRLLLAGATIFGAGSILAAFAASPSTLIAARAVMGFGGATLLPSSLAIISTMFPDATERSRAIGVWTAAFAGGAAVGPIVGGLLLHQFWWGSVFLINVPVLGALWLASSLLPADSRRDAADSDVAPFDVLGVVLSIGGILGVVYAIKHVALSGVDITTVGAGIVGLGLLAGFVVHCNRADHPLVNLGLLRNRSFAVAICTTLAAMMSLAATTYLVNEYLQSVTGREPLGAALLGIPMASMVCAFSLGSARIVARLGVRLSFITALLVCATGMLTLQLTGVHDGLWAFLLGSAIAGVGYGTAFSLVSVVAVGSVPPERAGEATGMSETSFELGQALGLALLGSLAAVVFTRGLASSGSPLRGTLDEVVVSAGNDAAVVETAKTAYMTGMHAALGTAAIILLVMAAVTAMVLPRERDSTIY